MKSKIHQEVYMNKQDFRYILRFTLEPSLWKKRADALLRYCEAAKIDDVMFFTNGEELTRGIVP